MQKYGSGSLFSFILVAACSGGKNFRGIVDRINADIQHIEAGNTTASDEEISFLSGKGSVCFEEQANV